MVFVANLCTATGGVDSIVPHLMQPDVLTALVVVAVLATLVLTGTLIYVTALNGNLRGALQEVGRAREQLRERERLLRIVTENVRDVLWTLGFDGRFTYFSPSIETLTGWTPEEALRKPLPEHLSEASYRVVEERLARLREGWLRDELLPELRLELEQRRKDGSTFWVEINVSTTRDEEGRVYGLVGVTRDISEQRALRERIGHLAHFDPLTDLPNRALLEDRAQQALVRLQREGGELAMVFLDLDHFKPVNDEFGHEVGDQLLRLAAERIRAAVRASDTVARVGGDEFVLLLERVAGTREAATVAEKTRHALREPFQWEGRTIRVSATLGVALAPAHGKSVAELTRKADAAMYAAKAGGRDCVVVFDEHLPVVHPMG